VLGYGPFSLSVPIHVSILADDDDDDEELDGSAVSTLGVRKVSNILK
jgi:hypothetical protein